MTQKHKLAGKEQHTLPNFSFSMKQALNQLDEDFTNIIHIESKNRDQFCQQASEILTNLLLSQPIRFKAPINLNRNMFTKEKKRKLAVPSTSTKRRRTSTEGNKGTSTKQTSNTKTKAVKKTNKKQKVKQEQPRNYQQSKQKNSSSKSKPSNKNQSMTLHESANITNHSNLIYDVDNDRSLPWWRAVDARVARSNRPQNPKNIMKGFIMAVIRSSIRKSWNAESLLKLYNTDPSSSQGKAFQIVSYGMLLMEQARHMGQCHNVWHGDLIKELMQRREIKWASLSNDSDFEHFAGCDACLGHRQATIRLLFKGARYDSSGYWPNATSLQVLSTSNSDDCITTVAVEMSSVKEDDFANSDKETEFWVDAECLRKCLVFHELAHATSILTIDVRSMVEAQLRNGVIRFRNPERKQFSDRCIMERVEEYLVQTLSKTHEFIDRWILHLTEILELGDVYFSSQNIQHQNEQRNDSTALDKKVYDSPIRLKDERFSDRINKLLMLTRNPERQQSCATFF